VRTGDETIVFVDGKPVITENLCVGCGICVRKCPFGAITITNLPEEMEDPIHRYGQNGFALYGLPVPVNGRSQASWDPMESERARQCPSSLAS